MKIVLASDHAGFALKESVKIYLQKKGFEVVDFGCTNPERCDYPDFAAPAARAVSAGQAPWGVLICGSGTGMCTVANRFPNVRAAVLRVAEDAVLSRAHNNANVACLGARLTKEKEAYSFLDTFLATAFEAGRHIPRIEKIEKAITTR